MMKTRLVMLLALAVLVASAPASYATTYSSQEWQEGDWDCHNNPYNPGVPLLSVTWDWSWDWQVTPDGSIEPTHLYQLYGAPPDPVDPDVDQTVVNRSSVTWTDWHVEITNGTFISGSASVYNVQVSDPAWVIVENATGFDAHVVSGKGTEVRGRPTYQSLHVFFSYLVDEGATEVTINQYPTSYYPIPEPATIASLLAGCLAFGFRIRRKA